MSTSSNSLVVIGMQWGDEGKGKIVDLLCPAFDVVVRYQGGNNAGHTVRFGERHFALHLVPSGILHPGARCVLGNGMVVDPAALFGELDRLREAGVELEGRLFVSSRAHAILPIHVALDGAREAARGDRKIGTTARGIGPAYETKAARFGLRLVDLGAPDLEARLVSLLARCQAELAALGAPAAMSAGELALLCRGWAERLAPMLADTQSLLADALDAGERVLFEGAQGCLLDLDHGTYPFVTSSSATAGGACAGAGVPPGRIGGVLGVLKAYSSRVGMGPFPTELAGETGDYIRQRGNEFGTTTGRPRRCGWLDLPACRYARRINGVDAIALTKLDVLDALSEIPVAVGYRIGGVERRDFPSDLASLEAAEPVYQVLPGWRSSIAGAADFDSLPPPARDYVTFLETGIGAPVAILSTGPRREETILLPSPALARLTGGKLASIAGALGIRARPTPRSS